VKHTAHTSVGLMTMVKSFIVLAPKNLFLEFFGLKLKKLHFNEGLFVVEYFKAEKRFLCGFCFLAEYNEMMFLALNRVYY
jgi:hypothetical protein